MSAAVAPAFLITPAFIAELTPEERLVLPYVHDLFLRPNQRIPSHDWRYCGFVSGRGFGKTYGIAAEINRRVREGHSYAPALQAPTDDRVEDVQIKELIRTSPPWFRAERYRGTVRWPNGVQAETFTPEAPGRSRSGNFDLVWLTELVDWQATTRDDAFDNLTTACRTGAAQVFWDTTSKGRNSVIKKLTELSAEDPYNYPIIRGSSFDNPILTAKYLKSLCDNYTGRRYEEEVLGKVFAEAEGALWQDAWLRDNSVQTPPPKPQLTIIGIDPALSAHSSADLVGLCRGSLSNGEVYIEDDMSDRLQPHQWGDIAVDHCVNKGASGCIVERNHLGDNATFVLRSRAKEHGYQVRVLKKGKPFPQRTEGVIYVRELNQSSSKTCRAGGPAAETKAGRVHIVGTLPDLEEELTTYEPGSTRSPNRYDACVMVINELAGLDSERQLDPDHDIDVAAAAAKELRLRLARVNTRGRLGI